MSICFSQHILYNNTIKAQNKVKLLEILKKISKDL